VQLATLQPAETAVFWVWKSVFVIVRFNSVTA
jgi:hypothetical protein